MWFCTILILFQCLPNEIEQQSAFFKYLSAKKFAFSNNLNQASYTPHTSGTVANFVTVESEISEQEKE